MKTNCKAQGRNVSCAVLGDDLRGLRTKLKALMNKNFACDPHTHCDLYEARDTQIRQAPSLRTSLSRWCLRNEKSPFLIHVLTAARSCYSTVTQRCSVGLITGDYAAQVFQENMHQRFEKHSGVNSPGTVVDLGCEH